MHDELYDVVDRNGKKIGTASWAECHEKGLLHQTAGVFVFKDSSKQELLVQLRSGTMSHSPGLLQHSAGGHIVARQTPEEGIRSELQEELFSGHDLPALHIEKVSSFFHNDFPGNNEIFHIFETVYPGPFFYSKQELAEPPRWMRWDALREDMKTHPKKYAPSFHFAMKEYLHAKDL